MKFRFFSDMHLEKDLIGIKRPSIDDVWSPSDQPDDKASVLILAGDVWNGTRPLKFAAQSWIARLSARFKAVVVVFGNHDYWGSSVDTLGPKWRRMLGEAGLENVHVLELADGVLQGTLAIDGVLIVGSTMWTNMDRRSPLVKSKFDFEKGSDGRFLWNDKNYIRSLVAQKFTSSDWLRRHTMSVDNFRLVMASNDAQTKPVLVVFHHAPCMLSTQDRGQSDPYSKFLYGSDLSGMLLDYPNIEQVIHGHVHDSLDYDMGGIRIRCNPRGYAPGSLNKAFDPIAAGEIQTFV